jgi:hypothetical protein
MSSYQFDPLLFWQHGTPSRGCGFGDYEHVGDWSWQFYPFEYAWLAPADSAPQPAPHLKGFGCSGGCSCGGKCKSGMGQASGPGLFGTGLFTSMDPSTWGWGEWLTGIAVLYVGSSLLGDVSRAGRATGAAYRGAKKTYKR